MVFCKNNSIELAFDEKSGVIKNLLYCGKNYAFNEISIFEIAKINEAGDRTKLDVTYFELESVQSSDDSFECVYKNLELTVRINAVLKKNIEWHININNNGNDVIEWVNYPQIVVENDLKDNGGDSKILWGFNEGAIVDSLKFRDTSWGYIEPEYPGMGVMGLFPAIVETQFMAYMNNERGLYFAAHDKDGNLKGIDFYEYNDGIKLQFRHYTNCDFKDNYEMPYTMVMEFFEGDWMDASEIYRTWFEENASSEFIPIKENKKLPEWYSESPVIVTYPVRGLFDTDVMNPNKLFPYTNAMKYIEEFEKKFDSRIMVILMHWEGTAPWAPPYVWPPYGGEDELKKFIDALHERGDVIGVYCSGIGWTQHSNLDDYHMDEYFEKNNLKKTMCLSEKQELPLSKICTAQRSGYDLCPSEEFTNEVICDQVKKMVSSGLDYIQIMEQNHGGNSYFCYAKNHKHPPVPGKWQTDAIKNLLNNAQQNSGKVLFGCESAAAESYIPQLLFSDNRFNLCYTIGEPVPVYSYIYHKYLNNFMGNQVATNYAFDHKRSPENINVRIVYSFCAGDMLTVILNDDGKFIFNWGYEDLSDIPDQENVSELVKNLNSWRRGFTKKYLHTGVMKKPYKVKCGRRVMYGVRKFDHEYDEIFTCAWSAENSFGQFLVNYNSEDITCTVDLPEGEEFLIYTSVDSKPEKMKGKVTVKKLSAVLIERV